MSRTKMVSSYQALQKFVLVTADMTKKNKKTKASSLPTIQLTSCCHFSVQCIPSLYLQESHTLIPHHKPTCLVVMPITFPTWKKGLCVSFQSGDQTYLGGVVVTIIDKHLWLLHLKSSKDIAVTLYIIALLVVNLETRETFQCVFSDSTNQITSS